MTITERQKAIAEAVGLKWKDLGFGKVALIKAGLGEEVPSGTELNDIYYPSLFQHVVSQAVTDGVRVFALENGVFVKEDWINGIKEFLSNGILTLYDYDKEITIEDFNPADATQNVIKFSIDFEKFASEKISKTKVLQSFTTPATLEAFISQIIKRLSDSFRLFIQNEKAKILANVADAALPVVWDEIVDVSGMTNLDIIELVNHYMISMETASPDWLALTDETFIYSATKDDLQVVMRPYLKSALIRENASLFNGSSFLTDKILNAPTIDMVKAGFPDTGHVLNLMDKRALIIGYQMEDVSWDYKVPKLQNVLELHNWFGFAYNPVLYKSIWTTTPAVAVAQMKKIKGQNFNIKITKGIDIIKQLKNSTTLKG